MLRNRKVFRPEKVFRRISDIDIVEDILNAGFSLVILDIDGTVKNRLFRRSAPDILNWIDKCRAFGLFICFVSNDRRNRHIEFADSTDLPLIAAAHKPSPLVFKAVCKEFGVASTSAVVIGNNPFTDVWGGHRAGLSAYLVRPMETTKRRKTKQSKYVPVHED